MKRNQDLASDLLSYERRIWEKGFTRIAGVDEAGVGPLAGPVVAAAVILPVQLCLPGVRDSKVLSPLQRSRLEEVLLREAVASAIGTAEVEEIREKNIYHASLQAMRRALLQLRPAPDYVLVDARTVPNVPWPQEKIIRGDSASQSIAAASILAKEYRDRLMVAYDKQYPQYGFGRHKGYPTPAHQKALREFGPSPIHRASFRSVEEFSGLCQPLFYPLQTEIRQAASCVELRNLRQRLEGMACEFSLPERRRLSALLCAAERRLKKP